MITGLVNSYVDVCMYQIASSIHALYGKGLPDATIVNVSSYYWVQKTIF